MVNIGCLFISFYLIFIGSFVFHEFGHYISAILLGAPSEKVELVLMFRVVPVAVNVHDYQFTHTQELLFYFFGGFTGGTVFTILTIVFWLTSKRKKNDNYWWIGAFCLAVAVANFFQCYQEAQNHANYINFEYLPFTVSIYFGLPVILGIWKYRSRIMVSIHNKIVR